MHEMIMHEIPTDKAFLHLKDEKYESSFFLCRKASNVEYPTIPVGYDSPIVARTFRSDIFETPVN